MIVTCPRDGKQFEIESNLIPSEGRLLQCGVCGHKWHFKIISNNDEKKTEERPAIFNKTEFKTDDHFETDIVSNNDDVENKQMDNLITEETIKTDKTQHLNFFKIFLVVIITFISLIIVLDTFKLPLKNIFPGIEILLQNLYETLKDVFLFFKDLLK